MSEGQGSSTDPIINDDDEKEEEDLIEEFRQMTVNELPKDLQRLIFEYKFKDETVEDRKRLQNYLYNTINLNQNFLEVKQEHIDRYDNLYVDLMFSEDETSRNELKRQMDTLDNQIRTLDDVNNAIVDNYERDLEKYMRYTNYYRNRDKYG